MPNKRFVSKKKSVPCSESATLAETLDFLENALGELGIQHKEVLRTVLLAEELLPQLLQHADPNATLRVHVKRLWGNTSVSFRVPGSAFDPISDDWGEMSLDELEEGDAQQAIRSILLKSQGDRLKISHKNAVNHVRILVGQPQKSRLLWTIGALFAGLLFGLCMNYVFPAALSDVLGYYLLNPVKTMFMNALQIIIGPVVFFSIVSCIAQFKDLAELGRIAVKITGVYLATTVVAVLLSIGLSCAIQPGQVGFALSLGSGIDAVSVDTTVDTSIRTAIMNIVPSNFVRPFLESDTLQIIFLAVLCGVAVGMIGKYAPLLQDFFEACNALFLTITTLISSLIPLAVFCSTALMIVETGSASLLSVLGFVGTCLLSIACMLVFYGLLVFLLGRLNPLTFFRKNREGMLTSLTLSSSSAAMPTNMDICTKKMGVSPKVCSFSIPLGATINMDGSCIFLVTAGLFLARAYGVTVPGSALVSLCITIIMLSLGCPGVPGAALVCLGVVLKALGVPIEAIGLVMGVNPILDMFITMNNTTGDMAATLIVAKSEDLVDLETYRS